MKVSRTRYMQRRQTFKIILKVDVMGIESEILLTKDQHG
jgi:hypothetical protein